jgi:hypothetical protein
VAILRLVFLGIISFSLLACASSSINLSQGSKQKLTAVSISNNVVLPKRPLFAGPGSAFGVIGLSVKSSDDQANAIISYLKDNNIDVASIVKQSFMRKATQNNVLAGRLQQNADTVIELEVVTYGIGQKDTFSIEYKPMLSVVARMKDSGDRVIWEQHDFVTVIGGSSPARTLEQYFGSPEIFQVAFQTAADNVATQLLEDLN